MNPLYNLTPRHLSDIKVDLSVELFRDLLWCHARKYSVPITKIHITSRVTVSDGGIDAKIDDDVKGVRDDLLVSSGTSYQLKTGASFKPWQPAQLRKELFGKSKVEVCAENLDDGVKQCLTQGNRYIVVCFGVDPTSPEIEKAKDILVDFFEQCDFSSPTVEVWGQTHLIGLFSDFPSLVLKVLRKSEYQFQAISSWASNDEMTPKVVFGEAQDQWISRVRDLLRTTDNHLRIIGEPGIGKSRLVLEALSVEDLAPSVVYIAHAEDFQKSQLFNELIRTDDWHHIILVIDECPEREKASIWNVLKPIRSRCQLITIDHGPDNSSDDSMQILECPLLAEEQITAIINSYIDIEHEARRWAEWCSGSPRVAHAVGQNLKRNPDDILKPPATVPMWEIFIAGYEDSNSIQNQQCLIVLRQIALFHRFGFETPVYGEAQFIAELVAKVDPAITWGQFQSIVDKLRSRRILQGRTTLFIVPKALHTYLWVDYWKHYGIGFDYKEFTARLPKGLREWFTRMFIYAHVNQPALQIVNDILDSGGVYDDEDFLISDFGTRFLSVLAEADPKATLHCIERTYGSWSKEKLLKFEAGRQQLVWALEKIAVWPDTFSGAARILLNLGVAETSNYSNNATGTFSGLFGCSPMTATEVPPLDRLPILEEALTSEDGDERVLGLRACKVALSRYGGFRIIGPENQGLRPVAKLWMPKTYGEIWSAYRAVWNLLLEISRSWSDDERRLVNDALIKAGNGLVQVETLASEVLLTIEQLLDDSATDLRTVVNFVVDVRRFRSDNLSSAILDKINQIDSKMAGSSLDKNIERFVLNSTWSEERDDGIPEEQSVERRIKELVERVFKDTGAFLPLIDNIVSVNGQKLCQFGIEVGKKDTNNALLHYILNAQKAIGSKGTTQFTGGYLWALREKSESEWEKLIIELLSDNQSNDFVGNLIYISGVSDRVIEQMLKVYSKGFLHAKYFLALRYQKPKQFDQELIDEVLTVLLEKTDKETLSIATEVAYSFYMDKDIDRQLPKELIFRLLKHPYSFNDRIDTMQGYYWGELAKKYLITYPESNIEMFKLIMSNLANHNFMILKSNSPFHSIAEQVAKKNPDDTWQIIVGLLANIDTEHAYYILSWLREDPGFGKSESSIRPLTYFPLDKVMAWIDENPEDRARAIIRAAPKTLDKNIGGRITRELLHRYGHIDSVKSVLSCNFGSDGWSGSISQHYRIRRDQARVWLKGETSRNVIEWLEAYIDELSGRIEREEVNEERGF